MRKTLLQKQGTLGHDVKNAIALFCILERVTGTYIILTSIRAL